MRNYVFDSRYLPNNYNINKNETTNHTFFSLFSFVNLYADDVTYEIAHPHKHNKCMDGKIDLTISGGYAPYHVIYERLFEHPTLGNVWFNVYEASDINGMDGSEDYGNARDGQYRVSITDFHCGTISIMINELVCECTPCEISAEIIEPNCLGDDGGSISIQTVCEHQDSGSFNAIWADGESGKNRNELTPGRYCVTVTDDFQCETEKCWWIGTNNSLTPILLEKISPTFCGSGENTCDGSLTVGVEGGQPPYQIVWFNGSTSNKITGLCSGSYSVTVIDDKGCRHSQVYELCCCEPGDGGASGAASCNTEPLAMDFTVGTLPNGFINISLSGGAGGIVCEWDVTTTNNDEPSSHLDLGCSGIANINSEGEYCFTATDGCTSIGRCFNIIDCSKSDLEVSGSASSTCPDLNAGIATLNISGGNPNYFVQWSNGVSGRNKTQLERLFTGVYCATITDETFCSVETCITVDDNVVADTPQSSFEPCVTKHTCNGVTVDVDQGTYADVPTVGACNFERTCSETGTTLTVPLFPAQILSTVGCTRTYVCANGISDTEVGSLEITGPFIVNTSAMSNLNCFQDSGCTNSSVCELPSGSGAMENVPLDPGSVSCVSSQDFRFNTPLAMAVCGNNRDLRRWSCGPNAIVKDSCFQVAFDNGGVTSRNAFFGNTNSKTNRYKPVLQTSILLYPNPVGEKDILTISVFAGIGSKSILLSIFDVAGRHILDREIKVNDLLQTQYDFSLDYFRSGMYFMQFSENDVVIDIKKLIIQ